MCCGKKANAELEKLIQKATEEKKKEIDELVAAKVAEIEANKIINKSKKKSNDE